MKKLTSVLLITLTSFCVSAQCEIPFPEDDDQFAKQHVKTLNNEGITDFDFIKMNGDHLTLEQLKGKVVVINIWNFTCKPCIEEMPELNKLVAKYNDEAVFIGIMPNGTYDITKESLQDKIKKFSFDYETMAITKCIGEVFKIPFINPAHFVIGKDGKVKDLFFGKNIERLESQIKNNI